MDDLIASIIILVTFSIFYIPFVWGLYTINKKLGEKHLWLSFFPILQMYSIIRASGKSLWWILWSILIALGIYLVLFGLGFLIISMYFLGGSDALYFFENIFQYFSDKILLGITLLLLFYFFIISLLNTGYIIILHGISKRTNRGFWTTMGLFYIPFIMFPVVACKLKSKSDIAIENKSTEIKEPQITEL
ncbi:MAG: hypothetical protein GY828_06995 [Candidatus Gracilibacteria bacterium]|nr:hypothetical protein [Candidatus Gracilibacteria bacterium]